MIAHKKEFFGGFAMLCGFVVVLVLIFSPIFKGKNGLEYLDFLYNSISKGSAYYIHKVKEETDKFIGNNVTMSLKMADEKQAQQTAMLFTEGGATADVSGAQLNVSGDLGKILANCLVDADLMYYNDGAKVSGKYGYNERQVLYNWWKALKAADKDLKKQKLFKEAKTVASVIKKTIETSYNYYKIEPQKIGDKVGIVIFSLIFYVGYTLWYGFAILFMFEGWGLKLEH
ncbi:MAG: hypothetical protein H8E80_03725 [Desulfobacteraceae bacterium]|uniref:Uncharacterized protein n=1 Tax=Candidatus Desulfaltia bathyphila TaxID=2841697 RepID=A0A8J6T9Y8_9BACT|nr:hypothetical protein [Candidatus Desulfaltia bathyphila]